MPNPYALAVRAVVAAVDRLTTQVKRLADDAATPVAIAYDDETTTPDDGPTTCDVKFIGGGRCSRPAGHRPPGSQDPHVPRPTDKFARAFQSAFGVLPAVEQQTTPDDAQQRYAKAICKSDGYPWEEISRGLKDNYLMNAAAVIEAAATEARHITNQSGCRDCPHETEG